MRDQLENFKRSTQPINSTYYAIARTVMKKAHSGCEQRTEVRKREPVAGQRGKQKEEKKRKKKNKEKKEIKENSKSVA